MSAIVVENLSIKFRLYNASISLKEYFATLFRTNKKPFYSDFWAVKGVSFQIRAGERVGIIGHNGAGKSTLLKTLCKVYEPTSGHISIDGRIAPLLEIGAGFHPEFTGRENIYLNGAILGFTKKDIQKIEPDVIEFSEIGQFIDMPVKYYSTGMYMRLAFSLATAVRPDILILDEIFAGGDGGFVKKATERITAIINQAKIMVMVSHDISFLEKFCTRLIWMDHGTIKGDGPTKIILPQYLECFQNIVA